MLVVMDVTAGESEIESVVQQIKKMGLDPHPIVGAQRTAIGITGNRGPLDLAVLENLPGVMEVIRVSHAYKLVSREFKAEDSIVSIGGVDVGGEGIVVIGGPCAVESLDQTRAIAEGIKAAGGQLLRGGAFKPRTSPYSFQGLGERGLEILAKVRDEFDLPIVTEAIDADSVRLVEQYADCIQIGARNMQNFSLLRAAGRTRKPVLLKPLLPFKIVIQIAWRTLTIFMSSRDFDFEMAIWDSRALNRPKSLRSQGDIASNEGFLR